MKRIIAGIVVAASIPIAFATPADALTRNHRCEWFAHRHIACFPLKSHPIIGTAERGFVGRLPVIPPKPAK